MEINSLLLPLFGGMLIGLAAVILMAFNGRVAGISGIINNLIHPKKGESNFWRLFFLIGLIGGGALTYSFMPQVFTTELVRSPLSLIISGLLVGFGVERANGCTSGHGVCGIGMLSTRSIWATITFIGTGMVTVWIVNQFFGGAI